MRDAGINLAVPPRRDTSGWRALTAMLDAGLTFTSRCCSCQVGAGYRPRTAAQLRNRYRPIGELRADACSMARHHWKHEEPARGRAEAISRELRRA